MATAHGYTKLVDSLWHKKVDIGDSFYMMLLSAYTPDRDGHQYLSDVLGAGTEATGTGYTANGLALTSVALTESGHVYSFDADDPSWDASAGALSAAFAVAYDRTPSTNATRPVIAYADLGGTVTATGAAFTLVLNASGLWTATVA